MSATTLSAPKCAECGLRSAHKMSCSTGGGWYPPGKELPRRKPGLSITSPERAHWPRAPKRREVMHEISTKSLLLMFRDAEGFGSIRPGEVCTSCGKVGAARANDARSRPLARLYACQGCQNRITAARKQAEAARARRNQGKK